VGPQQCGTISCACCTRPGSLRACCGSRVGLCWEVSGVRVMIMIYGYDFLPHPRWDRVVMWQPAGVLWGVPAACPKQNHSALESSANTAVRRKAYTLRSHQSQLAHPFMLPPHNTDLTAHHTHMCTHIHTHTSRHGRLGCCSALAVRPGVLSGDKARAASGGAQRGWELRIHLPALRCAGSGRRCVVCGGWWLGVVMCAGDVCD